MNRHETMAMSDLQDLLLCTLWAPFSSFIQRNTVQRLWVAYSGGLDSTVLLHSMARLNQYLEQPRTLIALHVNHQLSPYADQWQQHCEVFSESIGVPCHVQAVMVASEGRGLEAAARSARYQAFEHAVQTNDGLLMGHHLDDQAETVLLRLMRGASLKGLSAMPQERPLGLAISTGLFYLLCVQT